MNFKETFRSRNALKNSGLRVGIRIAFTDYEQGCAIDCAGRRLPGWGICSGPGTFFPFGDRAARPSAHLGQQRPKGFRCQIDTHGQCRRRVPVSPRNSCVLAGTVHKRHLPSRADEALGRRPLQDGLSGFPPAGHRAAARSAEPGGRSPHLLAGVARTTVQAPPRVTGHLRPWWEIQEHAPKLAHAH